MNIRGDGIMQIVIDISEEDKQEIDRCLKGKGLEVLDKIMLIKRVVLAVFHGKPLPKGHGDLIDYTEMKRLAEGYGAYTEATLSQVKPNVIIEADESVEE